MLCHTSLDGLAFAHDRFGTEFIMMRDNTVYFGIFELVGCSVKDDKLLVDAACLICVCKVTIDYAYELQQKQWTLSLIRLITVIAISLTVYFLTNIC